MGEVCGTNYLVSCMKNVCYISAICVGQNQESAMGSAICM